MAARSQPNNISIGSGAATVSKAAASHSNIASATVTLLGISGHTIERWADGTWWDTTAGSPICVDKLNQTGTPRFQDN